MIQVLKEIEIMNRQKISPWLRTTGTLGTVVATATLATGILAPQASAQTPTPQNLVPNVEGQVDVIGAACITPDDCVTLNDLIESITSWANDPNDPLSEKSLLFVDDLSTSNIYDDGNNGNIVLNSPDVGTNPTGYWFRPVLVSEENGQLEVGTFEFKFKQTLDELSIEFFDIETWRSTGVLKVNGEDKNQFVYGSENVGNGSLNNMTFEDVDSIVLKLGKDFLNNTGDGVDFQLIASIFPDRRITKVPEPSLALGLGAVAGMGLLGLRKRKNKQI